MASFTDLVRAQRQSGKSAATSLSGAYNQLNMQRFDPRNALFSQTGLMTALFPSLKGYQASPISKKSPTSMISPEVSGSPTALSSIARDARISARNSMALPSIARNMAQLVRIWGGTPSKYFEGAKQKEEKYESKFGSGKKGLPGLGKTAGGGGFNIMGMLSGIGGAAGGLLGGAASIIGSIFGGIGSLVGGAFRGVFGVLGSALGNMGFIGVILAGVVGFALYSLYKSLDFSKLGGGIGESLSGIKEALSGLYKELDGMTGGRLGTFIDDTQKMFKKTVDRLAAGMETAITLFKDLGTAVIKDMYGFIYNIFKENQGKVLGMVTIGALAAFAGVGGLKGAAVAAAISAAMAAYGALTSEKSLEEMKYDLGETKKARATTEEQLKTPNMPPSFYESRRKALGQFDEKIKSQEAAIAEKEARTSNTQSVLDKLSTQGFTNEYQQNLAKRETGSPTPAISGAPLLDLIGAGESGRAGYDAANRGKAGDMLQGYPGLSRLTVGQVMDLQARKEIFAAGRYQIIPQTLASLIKSGVAKREDIFSPVVQDKLAMELINRRLKAAGSDPIQQQLELSKEFAAIADPRTGKSFYEGRAGNKASISTETMQAALRGESTQTQLARGGATPAKASSQAAPMIAGAASSSVASLAYDQITALDKLMGGKLMEGSTVLADMLRDVTREFMNNPTFVDSSQTVNNTMPPGLASAVGSAYNPDATNLLVDRATS